MKSFRLVLFIPLIFISSLSLCQESTKFPVEVGYSGNDVVGSRLFYLIKEGIRKSSSMQLTDEKEYRIQLLLVTLEPSSSGGYSSVYSAVWTLNNPNQPLAFYITSSVGTCGSKRVEEVAENLVADTDKHVSELIKIIKSANRENSK